MSARMPPKQLVDKTFSTGGATYRITALQYEGFDLPTISITRMTRKGNRFLTLPSYELAPLMEGLQEFVRDCSNRQVKLK